MGTVIDRRKYSRRTPSFTLKGTLVDGETEHLVDVLNVSNRGICLKTSCNATLGSFVRLRLLPDEGESIELEGRLMWKKTTSAEDPSNSQWGLLVMNWLNNDAFKTFFTSLGGMEVHDRREKPRRSGLPAAIAVDNRLGDRRSSGNVSDRFRKMAPAWDRFESVHRYGRVIQQHNGTTVVCHGKRKIMLGSNNYLGLTHHPLVMEAVIKAVENFGTGSGGARVLTGTSEMHKEFEEKLAAFKGAEACHVFNSGYVANHALMTSLLEEDDVVFNDQTNHASIIDGCRASEGVVRFYKHSDCANLEKKLLAYPRSRRKVIVTDGVFSMDGDIARLDEIYLLAKRHDAFLVVDDAHATGMIGKTGRGTAEHCGIEGKVDATMVTLSKSLGSIGGAVCGSKPLIKYLFHRSRPFIFATALPASAIAAASAALDVIKKEPELLEKLEWNRKFFVDGLKHLGYNVVPSPTAIIPMIIGHEVKAYQLATMLDEMGVFANAVSRPSVPRELSRLRVTVMATHSKDQLAEALWAFQKAGKALGVI